MKILLADIRKSKLVTLKKLENATGISKATLQRIEVGIVSPTMNNMEKIAKALEVGIIDLFESKYKYFDKDSFWEQK